MNLDTIIAEPATTSPSPPRKKPADYRYTRKRDSVRTGTNGNGPKVPRPFVSWDGEGAGNGEYAAQDYCVFGNSAGGLLIAREGHLSSRDLLQFIIDQGRLHPSVIHVAFGFGYDCNHIIRDIPFPKLRRLYRDNVIVWAGFRIEWFPHKWLMVSKIGEVNSSVRIYDTLGFWHTSLVGAIQQNPDLSDDPRMALIMEGKRDRGSFTHAQIDQKVIPYFQAEMSIHAELCERLRDTLGEASVPCAGDTTDLVPQQWYGPSAVVSTLFAKAGVKAHMNRPVSDLTRPRRPKQGRLQVPDKRFSYTLPDEVNRVARWAASGGRFEQFKIGRHDGPVYSYDITGAYPFAMVELPSLTQGRWEHLDAQQVAVLRAEHNDHEIPFGFYFIDYDVKRARAEWTDEQSFRMISDHMMPHPLFRRDEFSRVCYPMATSGWYPMFTAEMIWEWTGVPIREAWILVQDENHVQPFNTTDVLDLRQMYELRNHYRSIGRSDLAYALKITTNSGFGKTAQRKGVEMGDNLPAYHQMEWAATITDQTRAMIFRAARESYVMGELIAIETDAIYTTGRNRWCERQLGPGLGQFKREQYDGIIYLQSGIYFTNHGGEWAFHYRGLDRDGLNVDQVTEHLDRLQPFFASGHLAPLHGRLSHFAGLGQAGIGIVKNPSQFYHSWLTWPSREREIQLGSLALKRSHFPNQHCGGCYREESLADGLHDLLVPPWRSGPSHSRVYSWIDDSSGAEFPTDVEAERWGV